MSEPQKEECGLTIHEPAKSTSSCSYVIFRQTSIYYIELLEWELLLLEGMFEADFCELTFPLKKRANSPLVRKVWPIYLVFLQRELGL